MSFRFGVHPGQCYASLQCITDSYTRNTAGEVGTRPAINADRGQYTARRALQIFLYKNCLCNKPWVNVELRA